MIVQVPSNEFTKRMSAENNNSYENIIKKTYCDHVCEAIPLVCKNFKMKMFDHLLLGGEHTIKVSDGFNSPSMMDEDATPEEKKDIVLASPSFGMFSLFKYHLKYGYLNKELKKSNKVYCSHIFSLIFKFIKSSQI